MMSVRAAIPVTAHPKRRADCNLLHDPPPRVANLISAAWTGNPDRGMAAPGVTMQNPSFAELGLAPELLRAVADAGYTTPTPIQAQAIPVVLQGRDIMGGAQTGTGKTAGFALPILQKLAPLANASPSPARHPVRALILTPTRELAIQVEESFRTYGKYTKLRSTVVFGGVDIKQQLDIVRGGVEILVATPGRLLDHIEHKSVYLGQVEIFVLDEADRMLDMGFIPDIKRIMALLPATAKRQNLLFSATFSNEIKKLADQLLNAPQLIEVARRNTAAETVTQTAYKVPAEGKRVLLEHLVRSGALTQVLCFMRTKHGASRLARQLARDGIAAESIHGDKSQQARLEALDAFKDGKLQVLVATDVAARGLDIDMLPHVLNYELPHVPEDYIHRIGRTGRAGASGEAISFVAPEEERYLADIERLLKKPVPVLVAEGVDIAAGTAPRSAHAPRGERTSGGRRSDRPARTAPAERRPEAAATARARREPAAADTRREARERAYALNPDQPLPPRPASTSPHAKGEAHRGRAASHRSRPVAALLMKRPAPEPEKV
jgi:ATP-dependent RNA helicase RhlE